MRMTLLVLIIPLLRAAPGFSQASRLGPSASVLFNGPQRDLLRSMVTEAHRDTLPRQIRPTYWQEGVLIGGLLGAVGGAFLGHGLCETSEEFGKNCTGSLLLGGVLGAGLLAIPGALIGGQFPKHEDAKASRPE
jgi:hypothetical protein